MGETPDKYLSMVRRAIRYKMVEQNLSDQAALAQLYEVHSGTVTRLNTRRWSPAQRLIIEALTDFCVALRSGEILNGGGE